MALDVGKLKAALDVLSVAPNFPVDSASAGQAWANAIHPYSLDGLVNLKPILLTNANKDIMATAFAATMITPGTPSTTAQAIQTALDAYWITATTLGQIGPPAPVGGPVLKTALEVIFTTPSTDADAKTTAVSGAIDIYTKAVVFNILIPPSTPFNVT